MKVEDYLIEIVNENTNSQKAMLDITKFILASIFDTSIVDIQDLAETILDKDMEK